MRKIYKYPIRITDKQEIPVYKADGTRSKIVYAGLDPTGQPCIWVEHFPGNYREAWQVRVIGTGHEIAGALEHVGSFVQDPFAWHVYV